MNFTSDTPPNTSGPPTGNDMDLVATHQRMLVAAALRTKGDMLELGCGWYSTPILHEISAVQGRRLITLDNQPYWLPPFEHLKSDLHTFVSVGWWGEHYNTLACRHKFGLVFVDHGQPIEREYAVRALIRAADVFVLHDTEEGHAYGYDRTLPMFRYKVTDQCQKTWTTIASNVTDVTSWNLPLIPPHDPSTEIT